METGSVPIDIQLSNIIFSFSLRRLNSIPRTKFRD